MLIFSLKETREMGRIEYMSGFTRRDYVDTERNLGFQQMTETEIVEVMQKAVSPSDYRGIHELYDLTQREEWNTNRVQIENIGPGTSLKLGTLKVSNHFFRQNLKAAITYLRGQPGGITELDGLFPGEHPPSSRQRSAASLYIHDIFRLCMNYVLYPWLLYKYNPPSSENWTALFVVMDLIQDKKMASDRQKAAGLHLLYTPVQLAYEGITNHELARRYCCCWLMAYIIMASIAPRGLRLGTALFDEYLLLPLDTYISAYVVCPERGFYKKNIDPMTFDSIFEFGMSRDADLQAAWDPETRSLRPPEILSRYFKTGCTIANIKEFLENKKTFEDVYTFYTEKGDRDPITLRLPSEPPVASASDVILKTTTRIDPATFDKMEIKGFSFSYADYIQASTYFTERTSDTTVIQKHFRISYDSEDPPEGRHMVILTRHREILREISDVNRMVEIEMFSKSNQESKYRSAVRRINAKLLTDSFWQTESDIKAEAMLHATTVTGTVFNYEFVTTDTFTRIAPSSLAWIQEFIDYHVQKKGRDIHQDFQAAVQAAHEATGVEARAYVSPTMWHFSFFSSQLKSHWKNRSDGQLIDEVVAPEYFVTAYPFNLLECTPANLALNGVDIGSTTNPSTPKSIPYSWNQYRFDLTRRDKRLSPWERLMRLANHPHLLWIYHPFQDMPWDEIGRNRNATGQVEVLWRIPFTLRPYLFKLVRALVCIGETRFNEVKDTILPEQTALDVEIMHAYYKYYINPFDIPDLKWIKQPAVYSLETPLIDTMQVFLVAERLRHVAADGTEDFFISDYDGSRQEGDSLWNLSIVENVFGSNQHTPEPGGPREPPADVDTSFQSANQPEESEGLTMGRDDSRPGWELSGGWGTPENVFGSNQHTPEPGEPREPSDDVAMFLQSTSLRGDFFTSNNDGNGQEWDSDAIKERSRDRDPAEYATFEPADYATFEPADYATTEPVGLAENLDENIEYRFVWVGSPVGYSLYQVCLQVHKSPLVNPPIPEEQNWVDVWMYDQANVFWNRGINSLTILKGINTYTPPRDLFLSPNARLVKVEFEGLHEGGLVLECVNGGLKYNLFLGKRELHVSKTDNTKIHYFVTSITEDFSTASIRRTLEAFKQNLSQFKQALSAKWDTLNWRVRVPVIVATFETPALDPDSTPTTTRTELIANLHEDAWFLQQTKLMGTYIITGGLTKRGGVTLQ